ncbi:MAG TPA: hypothetical protein VFQ61_35530 [Polyangiaceae bacterium]|nr:hypothetical protein [Polyangiaceae bacterium]
MRRSSGSRRARVWRQRLLTLVVVVGALGAAPQASAKELRWFASSHAAAALQLSEARTLGGAGGGIGAQAAWREFALLRLSTSFLMGSGAVHELALGIGVQRPGAYCPAVWIGPRLLMGKGMGFITPDHLTPPSGPAWSFGVTLAPLRFQRANTQLTAIAPYLGLGSDLPGSALAVGVTLLEVATAL